MDHEEAASVSWMISFRSSSITSWRHKCDSGQTHMDADAGLHGSSSPSFSFPQPPAFRGFSIKLVDVQLPIWCNSWWDRNRKQLFVSGLFASLSSSKLRFGAAVLFRCKSEVKTVVNILPPDLKEQNWHLWFGLLMTKNQRGWINRLGKAWTAYLNELFRPTTRLKNCCSYCVRYKPRGFWQL